VVFRVDTHEGDRLPVFGAEAVARRILERGRPFAPLARPAIVNGAAGAIVMPGRRPVAVIGFSVVDGRIVEIDVIANPERLRGVAGA
jgi:RNA polymerase sigma-70 factor (ECF subfamily)